ncbi:hypothetical protein L6259_00905 [Candidatus Parcubacteria bacterium]|nr:hypothetical protein [Patescibacteria group bacterium]MCG2693832.1 hypothetical protein [Candidatus Parcubacteria bacterium]
MNFLKLILIDAIFDVLYFPLWWYSKGLVLAIRWVGRSILELENLLGVSIWAKNIFTPMFGQYDLQGRIVSFFMRFFQIIFRSLAFLLFSAFYSVLFVIYLILPVITIYFIALHLSIL